MSHNEQKHLGSITVDLVDQGSIKTEVIDCAEPLQDNDDLMSKWGWAFASTFAELIKKQNLLQADVEDVTEELFRAMFLRLDEIWEQERSLEALQCVGNGLRLN